MKLIRTFFARCGTTTRFAQAANGPGLAGMVAILLVLQACGGSAGSETNAPAQPSAPAESTTAAVVATATPATRATEVAQPTPTVAAVVKALSGEQELSEALNRVYRDAGAIPAGACTVERLNGLVDEIYGIYRANPNKFSLAGGMASIYAELTALAKRNNNGEAMELAGRVKRTVEELIVQHLAERGLPAENKAQAMNSWNENVGKKVADIEDGGECSITLARKP